WPGASNLDEPPGTEVVVSISPPADIFGVDGVIILVVVLVVLFGSTQIPKLARSLGSAQKEFKKGLEEGGSEGSGSTAGASNAVSHPTPPPAVAPPPPAAVNPPTEPSAVRPGEGSPHAPSS
ncbi:MAG TPA: twin-arginine translocase TatA/TatE family subunit, partial [Acidimicrobiales bacterium]|nr:twin-arginine translocase TatA/TatE family subunit [Acidimicrobiales bacterium]